MTDIERIRELLPTLSSDWKVEDGDQLIDGEGSLIYADHFCGAAFVNAADAEFIALCRNNIEAVIEENERLEREVAALKAEDRCPACYSTESLCEHHQEQNNCVEQKLTAALVENERLKEELKRR